MRAELAYRQRIPHGGGFSWKDPATGVVVTGTNWDMLITNAYAERKANGIPTGLDFEREVEQQLCVAYPQECTYSDPNIPRKVKLTLGDVVRGTEVMAAHALAGSPLVSQEEANRRASICAGCQFNVEFRMPCGGMCASLRDLVHKISGARSTPYDSTVKSCGICSCFVATAVWLPLDIQCVGVTQEMKNQFKAIPWCWKQCP